MSGRRKSGMAGKKQSDKENRQLVLVDARVLPDIVLRTMKANQLLQSGRCATVSEAAAAVGISRTTYYKYRDAVMPYDEDKAGRTVTVHLVLAHIPGVISRVLDCFARVGANILTVSQTIPSGGLANASVSARIDQLIVPVHEFLKLLEDIDGVERVSGVTDRSN